MGIDGCSSREGKTAAQKSLGVAYYSGHGVAADKAEALRWYSKAADQGYAPAQCNLGRAYRDGDGVPRDYDEAARWYRKAADQGFTTANAILEAMKQRGEI